MMQIGATLPAHNLQVFQTRRAVFECSGSPLNPLKRASVRKPPESLSTEATKKHLSNLERLLQKQSHPNPPPDPKAIRSEPNVDGETRTRGILEGLSLVRVWPEMKAAEEMSPRYLNRLQHLLSKLRQSTLLGTASAAGGTRTTTTTTGLTCSTHSMRISDRRWFGPGSSFRRGTSPSAMIREKSNRWGGGTSSSPYVAPPYVSSGMRM